MTDDENIVPNHHSKIMVLNGKKSRTISGLGI
jgi:hypothetical protein